MIGDMTRKISGEDGEMNKTERKRVYKVVCHFGMPSGYHSPLRYTDYEFLRKTPSDLYRHYYHPTPSSLRRVLALLTKGAENE